MRDVWIIAMEDSLDLIMLSAFRYALGRQSYIVKTVIDFIRDYWYIIAKPQLQIMIKEIEEAQRENRLGNKDIDEPEWISLKNFLESKINDVER